MPSERAVPLATFHHGLPARGCLAATLCGASVFFLSCLEQVPLAQQPVHEGRCNPVGQPSGEIAFSALSGEKNYDDSVNEVITGCDTRGRRRSTPVPGSFARLLHLAPRTVGTPDEARDIVSRRYHQNATTPESLDDTEIAYFLGHGDPQ